VELRLTYTKPDRTRVDFWGFHDGGPFYRMQPCQDLVTAGFCLGAAGERYLVYLPDGGTTVLRTVGGRTYDVTWIDARNPSRRVSRGQAPRQRHLQLTAPRDDGDWLVMVTATVQPG
jgi:hypothetical protein